MRICAGALLVIVCAATGAAAQQGSVQISSSTQVIVANPDRLAGQDSVEPDLGLTIHRPGSRATFFLDLHAVQRENALQLGTASAAIRDLKLGGVTWTLAAGDTAATPSLSAYAFTNLFAPQVTFAGGSLSGFSPRSSLTVRAGRVTALRNIFGSDPQSLGQDMGLLEARFRPVHGLELLAHGSRVVTHDTGSFTAYIDRGVDVGGGARIRPVPTVEVSADAGWSRFVRRGSTAQEQGLTGLVGAKWAVRRGWWEVNAQRFSPGYFAVINTPFLDRQGAFASGQLEIVPAVRVFGGAEAFRTNLDPLASMSATAALPRGLSERAFAGVRLHVGGRSFVTLRTEQGDRTSKPVGRRGGLYDSDTGVTSVDIQTSARGLSASARYERRENVDRANGLGSYTQQTASAQLFGRLTPRLQLFGSAMAVQQAREAGGQTFWQGGGGLQVQVPRRDLWFRGEALFSRTDEWGVDLSVPHELYTAGLTGQLTARTTIAFDVMLDRTPQPAGSDAGPWLGRSMIRLAYTTPTGTARVASGSRIATRRRGTGTIVGVAFADWNGDGVQGAGEEPLAGVSFLYAEANTAGLSAADTPRGVPVTSGKDGQFAFLNVPEGRARVGLDLAALPVDFDPPAETWADTEARGSGGARLSFGLVPLGSIAGSVLRDANNDGIRDAADLPVDGAVLLLDNGARSEQTRTGAFRFDAVRPGVHAVKLLPESLPEGMSIAGAAQIEVVLGRGRLHQEAGFLVRLEQRPEIRKVFPPKGSSPMKPSNVGAPLPSVAAPATARAAGGRVSSVAASASSRNAATTRAWYAIQLAATSDRAHAWELVKALQAVGVEAYLSEDADGLAKVRVGSYQSRADARRALASIREHGNDGFIARITSN